MFMPSYVQVNEDEEEQVDLCVLFALLLFYPCLTEKTLRFICLVLTLKNGLLVSPGFYSKKI